jgi:hypothetical protein
MLSRVKSLLAATLLAAGMSGACAAELKGFPRIYELWFEQAAAEFNVPVELLQGVAYAETRWRPVVPKGLAKKTGEDFIEVDFHEGEMPAVYGIMGLRNDGHFGRSLVQAAALIRELPETLVTDTRANIRGAAALLAQYGNRKDRNTPLELWEEALAKFSGIPDRAIAELQTYEILNAVSHGRSSDYYKIKQRKVDLEKVYGPEKLEKLSASRIVVQFTPDGAVISLPNK